MTLGRDLAGAVRRAIDAHGADVPAACARLEGVLADLVERGLDVGGQYRNALDELRDGSDPRFTSDRLRLALRRLPAEAARHLTPLTGARVVRVDVESRPVGKRTGDAEMDALTADGYRVHSTVVTPDGAWAVVTMVRGD